MQSNMEPKPNESAFAKNVINACSATPPKLLSILPGFSPQKKRYFLKARIVS